MSCFMAIFKLLIGLVLLFSFGKLISTVLKLKYPTEMNPKNKKKLHDNN